MCWPLRLFNFSRSASACTMRPPLERRTSSACSLPHVPNSHTRRLECTCQTRLSLSLLYPVPLNVLWLSARYLHQKYSCNHARDKFDRIRSDSLHFYPLIRFHQFSFYFCSREPSIHRQVRFFPLWAFIPLFFYKNNCLLKSHWKSSYKFLLKGHHKKTIENYLVSYIGSYSND